MAALLVFLLLAVLQVAVYFYARNVLAASAADAARYAAAAGVEPAAGGRRAERLLRDGLDAADAARIRCSGAVDRDTVSGLAVATVRCQGRIAVLFSALPWPMAIDVRSSVLRESVP